MFERKLRVDFLSDWQIGSGLGDGAVADSILVRDMDGLPYLPGRAVKGALREGAWRLGLCRQDLAALVDILWGTESMARVSNRQGKLNVGSARLPADICSWLLSLTADSRALYVRDMTILRVQTALDKRKMVEPQSLRTLECGIPGLFFLCDLQVHAPALSPDWLDSYFSAVCATVKSMGADRSRGLGLCSIRPLDGAKEKISLPAPLDPDILKQMELGQ